MRADAKRRRVVVFVFIRVRVRVGQPLSSLRGGPPWRVPRDFHLHVGRVPEHAVERVRGKVQRQRQEPRQSRRERARLVREPRRVVSKPRAVDFVRPLVRTAQPRVRRRVRRHRTCLLLDPELDLFPQVGKPRGVLRAEPHVPAERGGVSVIHGVLLLLRHREEPSRRRQRVAPRRRRDEGVDAGNVEEPDGVAHLAQLGRERRLRRARAPRRGQRQHGEAGKRRTRRARARGLRRHRAGARGRATRRARTPRWWHETAGARGGRRHPARAMASRAKTRIKSVSMCGRRSRRRFSLVFIGEEKHALALLAVSSSGRPLLSPAASTRRVGLFPTRARFPRRRHRDTRSSRGERSRRRPHFPSSATLVIGASGAGEPAAPLGLLRRFPFSEASSSWPQSRLRDLSCCQAIERGGRGSVRRGRRGRRGREASVVGEGATCL